MNEGGTGVMLPAHLLELLTASVDGELSAAERRLLDKTLRDSEEARVAHGQMLSASRRVRQLPAPSLGDDFAAHIMQTINDRAMMPTPLPMPRRRSTLDLQRLLPWVSMATAAGVILMVGLFALAYFMQAEKQIADASKKAGAPEQDSSPVTREVAKVAKPAPERTQKSDPVAKPPVKEPEAVDVNVATKQPEPAEVLAIPPRMLGLDNVIATPSLPDAEPFKVVGVSLPVLLPLRDLDEAYPRKTTRNELKKNEVVRIDLFCKDGIKASEAVQALLKARGLSVTVDSTMQDRIRKKTRSDLMVYTDALSADEIASLLEQLGGDDKKLEAKKSGDGQFDKFMLAPFHPSDLAELAKLLGIPANQVKLPKPKVGVPADPRKPLDSITAGQLALNLPKGGSKVGEKIALIVPYGLAGFQPQNSREIKSFLEKRGERRPNTVPMMLVLRSLN